METVSCPLGAVTFGDRDGGAGMVPCAIASNAASSASRDGVLIEAPSPLASLWSRGWPPDLFVAPDSMISLLFWRLRRMMATQHRHRQQHPNVSATTISGITSENCSWVRIKIGLGIGLGLNLGLGLGGPALGCVR